MSSKNTKSEKGPDNRMSSLRDWVSAKFSDWREVCAYVWKFYNSDKLGAQSVALTFYSIFALVPIVAFALGLARGFGADEALRKMLSEKFYQYYVPEWFLNFADTALENATHSVVIGIGVLILIGVVVKLFFNIKAAFNDIWKQPHAINNWSYFCGNVLWFILLPFLLLALNAVSAPLDTFLLKSGKLFPVLSLFVSLMLTIIVFFLIYKVIPDAKTYFLPTLISACIASVLYMLFQWFFMRTQAWLFNYNKVYGSFAAFPLFLVWMSFAWQIILIGAEFCYVINDFEKIKLNLVKSPGMIYDIIRQLNIAAEIYAYHHAGNGSISLEYLCEKLNITKLAAIRDLQKLIQAKLIIEIKSGEGKNAVQYIYNANLPDSLTVIEAMRHIMVDEHENAEESTADAEKSIANPQMFWTLKAFYDICEKSPENLKLHELALKK